MMSYQQTLLDDFRATCERIHGHREPATLVQILEVAVAMCSERRSAPRRPITDYVMSEQDRLDAIARFDEAERRMKAMEQGG
jgi:hypothetical protein